MARTQPFFYHLPHVTGIMAPAPVPERYPYHDQNDCPPGQKVKTSGNWQYYAPATKTETRVRCAHCAALEAGPAQPATPHPTTPAA